MKMVAFFKKELTENIRNRRLLILLIVTVLLSILGPAIALLTPKLVEYLAEDMAQSGIVLVTTEVTAMDSWTQYFKNLPILVIVLLVMWSGSFTTEYQKHSLVPLVTKGLSKTVVYVAKMLTLFLFWSVLYGLFFGISYGYNGYYWSNAGVSNIGTAVILYWLFGVWLIALTGFFSAIADNAYMVLLGVGAVYLLSVFLAMVPTLAKKVPSALSGGLSLMNSTASPKDFLVAVVVTIMMIAGFTAGGIALFQKKDI